MPPLLRRWRGGDEAKLSAARKGKNRITSIPQVMTRTAECGRASLMPWFGKTGLWGGDIPKWTTSADAVLPWLSKLCQYGWLIEENNFGGKRMFGCTIATEPCGAGWTDYNPWSFSDSAPKAAVIALLRAHGVEVVFSA